MRLLCVAIQHGDPQSVHYLLKEAHVCVPEEPSNTNPAILAAYYGHTALVKELLDSLPGRQQRFIDKKWITSWIPHDVPQLLTMTLVYVFAM